MGRCCGADVLDPETKRVLCRRTESSRREEKLTTIGEKNVREIMVRGSSLASEAALSNAMITEVVTLASRMRRSARRPARPSSRR